MVKLYEQWLSEGGRDLSAPVPFEYEAGKAKVFADPEAENWIGEVTRSETYSKLLNNLRTALNNKNDDTLRNLLKDARELPLFGIDASNAWRQSMIDSPEYSKDTAEYRKHLAIYVVRKLELFFDWVKNK